MHENRETSGAPRSDQDRGRSVKAKSRKTDMHVPEESDCVTVPMNQPNNEDLHSTEVGEGRARAKENIVQSDTSPTQSGERVSQGLSGVRRRAKEGKQERFTALLAQTEGAKFWLQVVTEQKNRGVKDILIACVDGLKGFPEAIESVFPQTVVQLCIVHLVRHSLHYVNWKERKAVARDLKTIYTSATDAEAEQKLAEFSMKWDAKYPMIAKSWHSNWTRVIPFFAHPPEIRRVIYTTNAIESLNMSLRKVTKARGSFPNDEAVFKLLYLALRNIAKKWTMPVQDWKAALNRFAIIYENRLPV